MNKQNQIIADGVDLRKEKNTCIFLKRLMQIVMISFTNSHNSLEGETLLQLRIILSYVCQSFK